MKPSSGFEDFGDLSAFASRSHEAKQDNSSVALFLALYLLLLAFFILMVAISQGENPKTTEIVQGLSSRFASTSKSTMKPTQFSSDLGNYVSPADFLDATAKVYETAIPAAQIKIVKPGQVMEISFHTGTLFEFGTETLRPAQRRVISELVPSLSLPPPGVRYQVEILFGFKKGDQGYPVAENSLMRKAGIVARAFVEQGAPPHSVMISMEPDIDPKYLHMIYHVLDEDSVTLSDARVESLSIDSTPASFSNQQATVSGGRKIP